MFFFTIYSKFKKKKTWNIAVAATTATKKEYKNKVLVV